MEWKGGAGLRESMRDTGVFCFVGREGGVRWGGGGIGEGMGAGLVLLGGHVIALKATGEFGGLGFRCSCSFTLYISLECQRANFQA